MQWEEQVLFHFRKTVHLYVKCVFVSFAFHRNLSSSMADNVEVSRIRASTAIFPHLELPIDYFSLHSFTYLCCGVSSSCLVLGLRCFIRLLLFQEDAVVFQTTDFCFDH